MSDLIPGSLYAFNNLARDLTNCVLFIDKVCMTRRNRSIMYSRLVRSKKTFLRIALPTDYGINADTKLTMFGIYSAAMNVAGTFL